MFRPTDVGAFSTTTPSSVCRGSSSTCVAAMASLTTAKRRLPVCMTWSNAAHGVLLAAAADIFSFNRDRIPERIWRDRSPAIILLRKKIENASSERDHGIVVASRLYLVVHDEISQGVHSLVLYHHGLKSGKL